MDRKKEKNKIENLKAIGEENLAGLNAKLAAAKAALEKWEQPKRTYEQLVQQVNTERVNLDRRIGEAEMSLAADAATHIGPARSYLEAEFQKSRIGIYGPDDAKVTGAHLDAIRAAIKSLDELATSGEADVPGAVKRIMETLPNRWKHGADVRFERHEEFNRTAQTQVLV